MSRLHLVLGLALAWTLTPALARAEDPPPTRPTTPTPPAATAPAASPAPPAEWLDEPRTEDAGADGDEPPSPVPASPAPPSAEDVAASTGRSARAEPDAAGAVVHHAPISTAQAGDDFVVDVELDDPHLAEGITLVTRSGTAQVVETPFARSEHGYRAVLAGAGVRGPFGYAIELELQGGRRVAAFASRDALHPVQILPDATDERERALLEKVGGKRSRASVSGEYADFGSTTTRTGVRTDRYWGVEGRYTYRPLRTVAEFGFRGGVVRGSSDGAIDRTTGAQPEVGLNYGASSVRFRFTDLWHMELEGLASISDEGFSTGGGTKLLVGDPYGSKLVLGASFVGISADTYFGSKFFSRVDLAAHERVTVAPIIEITDMPNADRYGVRLLAEVDVEIGAGFSAQLNGGYQARRAASGGPAIGGGVSLDF